MSTGGGHPRGRPPARLTGRAAAAATEPYGVITTFVQASSLLQNIR